MTTNEREIAIREGNKIYAETSYFTPRPQLDFVNARYVFCEGFDRGYIAATTEANKRIADLKSEVAELKEKVANYDRWLSGGVYYTNDESFKLHNDYNNKISELQASNNTLREAFNDYHLAIRQRALTVDIEEKLLKLLKATPAESLQAFENSVIEKCAKVADAYVGQECLANAIRALKEVK